MVEMLWKDHVDKHFPKNTHDYQESLIMIDSLGQFPFCFWAIDGCHIPIKCPAGGLQTNNVITLKIFIPLF